MISKMFNAVPGWVTKFTQDGETYGGSIDLSHDARLEWQIGVLGGVKGQRILELGPLEGGHTKMLIEAGAASVIAIEGNPSCWLRCLIVQQAFKLQNAEFVLGEFCGYVENYDGQPFDMVSASGMLYHQTNPAKLIHQLARITNRVIVWSQVAGIPAPKGKETKVRYNQYEYCGRINHYGGQTVATVGYCGGMNNESVWLYPLDMIRCFEDAGFKKIIQKEQPTAPNGDCLLFVAQK